MVLLGTSGFSYDDWIGTWYPPGTSRNRMLEAYADVFDAVEINSTYYRTPSVKTAESMVDRAAGRLKFSVKAPGDLTHRRVLDPAVVGPFCEFLGPFDLSQSLFAVLLQFPNAFRADAAAWKFLDGARRTLAPLPLVAEFRHESWDTPEADERLGAWQLSRAAVDQPELKGLSQGARLAVTGPVAYVRFHGRNAAQWYASDNSSDRYRYRYSEAELKPWVPLLRDVQQRAQTTAAFFNNHPDGGAPKDAETMAALLGQPLRGAGYRDLFG